MDPHEQELSLDDAIGQCFMVGFYGTEPPQSLIELIARDRVGGVILFSRNCRGGPAQVRALTARLQAAARAAGHPRPLLIAIDQENGLVRRLGPRATQFPGNMALGAAGDPELTAAVAQASGEELHALGINLNLAPVADVNNNPANPVIGARSFGEDPAVVGRHVAAAVRGYTAGGVIATLKHFPGHGDTATDSHLGLPMVPHDRARLEAVELLPFQAGLAEGAECVLTAHVALPRLTGGRAVPATLAPEIVRGLLREELGFDGVAITDCLEMDAVARGVGVAPGAIAALLAGNDIVLISHRRERQRAGLAAVRNAVEKGILSAETVQAAAARVLRLKRGLSWEDAGGDRTTEETEGTEDGEGEERPTAEDAEGRGEGETADVVSSKSPMARVGAYGVRPQRGKAMAAVGSPEHRELAARAYARGITLIRDDVPLLPLRLAAGQRIVVVAWRGPVSKAVDARYTPEVFVAAIHAHNGDVSSTVLSAAPTRDELQALQAKAASAEIMLLLTLNAHRDPAQAEVMRALAAKARQVVMVAVADPYDAATLSNVPTVLATYDYSTPALEAAAHALFAADPPPGRLPVSLGA
ncbi:MAG TPA: glycoside hydrolase family 3 protein [Ktedonobacterales bacterium]